MVDKGLAFVIVAAASVAGCVAAPSSAGTVPPDAATSAPDSPAASTMPRSSPGASASQAVRATPPPWAFDLPGELECDTPPQQIGAVVGETLPVMTDDADPQSALASWIGNEARLYVVLPLEGYTVVERAEHWVLFAHEVDGASKVVVVVADAGDVPLPGRWSTTAFASCDASEFEPGVDLGYDIQIWSDDQGRVSTSRLLDREDCYGGRALRLEAKLYVRDPTGQAFDPAQLLTTYDGDVDLPDSATATEYHDGDRHLYLDGDGSAAFIETRHGVERWPRVRGDEYLRTDCN